MSAVQGKVRENREFTKQTGFFEGKVVAINPSKEKIEKMLGTELDEDPVYISEEEGVAKAQIVFWIKDMKAEEGQGYRSVRFFLKDVQRENKISEEDKATKVKKKQYINSIGLTTWADNSANLPEWFVERDFRVAMEGEEELYGFVTAWLNQLDRKDKDTLLAFDFRRLIQGNIKELTELIGSDYEGTIVCLVTVRKVEKDGESKEYEQIYNRDFMPGFAMKQVRLKTIDAEFIERAKATERKKRSVLQRFVLKVTDSQYGIKDFYTLGELEEYDPTKNPVNSDKVLMDGDTEY